MIGTGSPLTQSSDEEEHRSSPFDEIVPGKKLEKQKGSSSINTKMAFFHDGDNVLRYNDIHDDDDDEEDDDDEGRSTLTASVDSTLNEFRYLEEEAEVIEEAIIDDGQRKESFEGSKIEAKGVKMAKKQEGDEDIGVLGHATASATKKMCFQYNLKSFAILKTIGMGTFGRVVLATCPDPVKMDTVITCALKILVKKDVVDLKQVEHTNGELQLLKTCKSPFIANLITSFKDNSNLFLALEFVPGGEMFRHLRTVNFYSEKTALFYAAQVVLAFEYLHENAIMYRDLKPENILFTASGYIKLVDFGFAKYIPNNRTFTLCGTPEYLAPEVLTMKGYGRAVDFWGLGVLLYEMCAGCPPFQHEVLFEMYKKIVLGEFQMVPSFSGELSSLLEELLIVQPHKRIGATHGGCQSIKDHPFFQHLDWDALNAQTIKAPYIPSLKSTLDCSNFDEYDDVHVTTSTHDDFPDLFLGFDYSYEQ